MSESERGLRDLGSGLGRGWFGETGDGQVVESGREERRKRDGHLRGDGLGSFGSYSMVV